MAPVSTTGDAVAEPFELSEAVRDRHALSLEDLREHADPEVPELCILLATVRSPQLQNGTPPLSTEGGVERGAPGALVVQRVEAVPVTIGLPTTPMPASGYALVLAVQGSGGTASRG
ncbi:MAG: hypothetical protein IT376_16565 [Polyangiaceae bacterium]|nr:hypothetical protein [Polyangiaceae bacterium]